MLLSAIGLALLLAAALAPGAQAYSSGFQELAPSPAKLTSVAADPATGLIYAQENHGKKYFVYDPRTNIWSELAPAPIDSGNNGGATYLAGKIYVCYTGNSAEVAVYDIASNSWTTIANPLGMGTGDITSGNGLIYMAEEESFVQYDPTTGITTPLADPPEFADGDNGFEPWGGLQFTGTKIYGHEGNGQNNFAVYDIPTNTWTELPRVPEIEGEGAVLGSAWDPVTNTYLTYGSYGGNTLFRYDIESGSWTTGTVPFEVEDGGMAYVGLPGIEGIYMIEGESGTAFTRYNEQNQTDLSTSMSASVTSSSTAGEITYSIQVKNNGPERASGVKLSDPLPAGTKLVSASSSQGTCDSAVSCDIGVLASGAGADLTIKVTAGFGTVSNTATVSSKALDTNPSNDSATVSTSVTAPPVIESVQCVVPKLKGLRLKAAKKALRTAHCVPGKVTRRNSGKVGKGRVIRGAKKRGAVLPAGTKVKLTVSRGAKHKAHHKPKSSH